MEICKCIVIIFLGFYVFILVLSVFRFIDEDYMFMEYFVKYFGENIFNYFIIIFICKDDLEEDGKIFLDYILLFLL